MNRYEREKQYYAQLNKVANSHGVVVFGSTFAKGIPVNELKQAFYLDCELYNRSYTDLSVFDANDLLEDCIHSLSPSRILLNLGETDLARGYHSVSNIIEAYESLVTPLLKRGIKVVLVSLQESNYSTYSATFNKELALLAKRLHCQFADISCVTNSQTPDINAFDILKFFMLEKPSVYDIMLANA